MFVRQGNLGSISLIISYSCYQQINYETVLCDEQVVSKQKELSNSNKWETHKTKSF